MLNYLGIQPYKPHNLHSVSILQHPGSKMLLQVMVSGPLTFFLDGAHTPVSMQACVDWFLKTAPMHAPQKYGISVQVSFSFLLRYLTI